MQHSVPGVREMRRRVFSKGNAVPDVKLLQAIHYDGRDREIGETVAVDERDARILVRIKKAIRVSAPKVRKKRKDMRAGRNYQTRAAR